MKIKLNKLQSGGGIPSLSSTYVPVTVSQSTASPFLQGLAQMNAQTLAGLNPTKATKPQEVSDAVKLSKDLNGLDNDVTTIATQLAASARKDELFGTGDVVQDYYKSIALINKAKESKEAYKEAYDTINKKNGLQDIATTTDGKIVIMDKNRNIQTMTPEEYFKHRSQYIALTNGNLLYERSHNTKNTFNDALTNIVAEGTSFAEVQKHITDLIGTLGSDTVENSGFIGKENGKFKQGIAILQAMGKERGAGAAAEMDQDGLYKVAFENKSQAMQANYAIGVIWASLAPAQQALLKTRVGGSKENAMKLITAMVMKGVSSEFKLDTALQVGYNADGTKKAAPTAAKDTKLSPQELLLNGLSYSQNEVFNPGSSAYEFHVHARYGTLTGDKLGNGNTLQQLNKSSKWNGLLDYGNCSMGGVPINNAYFNKVMLGDSQFRVVELPSTTINGHIVPDMAKCKALEKLDIQLRNANITDTPQNAAKVNAYCVKNHIAPKYKQTGNGWELNTGEYKTFAVLSAYTDEGSFGGNDDDLDRTLTECGSDVEDNYVNTIRTQTGNKKFDASGSVYSGSLFIPMNNNPFSANALNGATYAPTPEQALRTSAQYQANEKFKNYKRAGSFSSYQ